MSAFLTVPILRLAQVQCVFQHLLKVPYLLHIVLESPMM